MPTPTAHPDGAVSTRRRRRRNQGIIAIIATVVAAAGITVALRGNDAEDTAGTLAGVQFTQVSAGNDHVIALDSTGRIWSWGGNIKGQLGNGQVPGLNVAVPTRIDTGSTRFVSVLAGSSRSGAIDTDGHVWLWGERNVGGVVGRPTQMPRISNVAEIDFDDNTAEMYLLDTSGRFYSVESPGSDPEYVGCGSDLSLWCPDNDVRFKSISANSLSERIGFVVGLGVEDRLHVWSRQGVGDYEPPAWENWKQAEVGDLHVVALRRDGTLWTWGDNEGGQLCLGNTTRTRFYSPKKVTEQVAPAGALNDIIRVEANDERTAVLNKWGIAWMCGRNSSGELGIGNTTSQTTFQRVGDTRFSDISLGNGFTVAIDTDGHIWTWGSDIMGQLGDGGDVTINLSGDSDRSEERRIKG